MTIQLPAFMIIAKPPGIPSPSRAESIIFYVIFNSDEHPKPPPLAQAANWLINIIDNMTALLQQPDSPPHTWQQTQLDMAQVEYI